MIIKKNVTDITKLVNLRFQIKKFFSEFNNKLDLMNMTEFL